MPLSAQPRPMIENLLLACLPPASYRRLQPHLEPVSLEPRQVLLPPHQPITHVYFPRGGLVSLIATMRDRSAIEVASIGREGMVGLEACWSGRPLPHSAIVVLPGEAVRLPCGVVQAEMRRAGAFLEEIGRCSMARLVQVTQTAACHSLHSVKERCCRWLLLARDRIDSDQLPLTQDFLARILGVRRASVVDGVRLLQKAGAIDSQRGVIIIRDRARLEAAACECYSVIRAAGQDLASN